MSTAPANEATAATGGPTNLPFLRRIRIRGYKSIAFCDVTLEPLTVLVGRNATGKSNFVDALAFLRDVVVKGALEAVKLHGGRDAVLCRHSSDSSIVIEVEGTERTSPAEGTWTVEIGDSLTSYYRVELEIIEKRPPRILRESLRFENADGRRSQGYLVDQGRVSMTGIHPDSPLPREWPPSDRSMLVFFGIAPPYVDFHEVLGTIGTYNFNPAAIRQLQKPTPNDLLEPDGRNLANVIGLIRDVDHSTYARICRYLSAITESVELLGVAKYGDYETARFRVANGQRQPLEFDASGMSDGTLRALAALAAAFQDAPFGAYPRLIAIEEPETSLHPAAMRALVDALDEATLRTQILLTTHSAEMLDNPTIRPENVRVVEMIDGQTVIGPVDGASVEIVRKKLDTLGGLERQNQLEPDPDDLDRQRHLSRNGQEPTT
jgi:predicted ATPase